jgi:AMP nucleosidase
VSDLPMTPEGVKTSKSDAKVSQDWSDVHLEIGIESLTEIDEKGEQIKHFQY